MEVFIIKRLIRKANHVSPEMHEEVNKDVIDGERTKRRQSSDSYLIAREICMMAVITPTNENMLKIMKMIDSGKYSDIGSYKENTKAWINRTIDLFKSEKIILSEKKTNKQLEVYEIANRLYSTIPLVPVNNIIQNIVQDIQYGLYDDCGDPNINWDSWKTRCVEILRQRKILGSNNKTYIL